MAAIGRKGGKIRGKKRVAGMIKIADYRGLPLVDFGMI